jgi:hypothetical protein
MGYDALANAVEHPFSGSTPGAYADPEAIKDFVSQSLTYQPENQESIPSKVVDFPAKVIQGSGKDLSRITRTENIPYLGSIMEKLPEALAIGAGAKATMAPQVKVPAGAMGNLESSAVTKPVTTPFKDTRAVPTTQELKNASEKMYDASEKAGVVIKPESTTRVISMIQKVADEENLGKLPPKISEAAAVLSDRIQKNQPLSLRDADKVRQLINDAKKSTDAADQRLAKIIQTKYDAYLDNLKPVDTLAGDSAQGVAMLKEAR